MKTTSGKSRKDYFAGALLLGFGLIAIFQGQTYQIGSLTQMGPGFFPVALGVLLVIFGIVLIVVAKLSAKDKKTETLPGELPGQWLAWALILASIAAFIILGKYGGFVPATFGIVFISALADRKNNIKNALILAVAMSIIAVVVFWWALQMQFALFTWGR